ncbi:MAG: class I SAM-dependent methyltransferase [Opitutaceae bacterium]|nr:class I SAM-dependent methyltransferase [Opitutaceae bacterium]
MGFYSERILPHLIHLTMRGRDFVPYRTRVVGAASGRVLEVGIGAGENVSFYGPDVGEIVGLEPAAKLAAMARENARRSGRPIEIIEASAEEIPSDAQAFDTVVMTWTLCSIADPRRALGEMRRVLRPGGRLLFAEHGLAPDLRVRKWQNRLTPVWKHLAGGCHLNRAMDQLIAGTGFRIEQLDTGYMRGLKPLTFMYEGSAKRAEDGEEAEDAEDV